MFGKANQNTGQLCTGAVCGLCKPNIPWGMRYMFFIYISLNKLNHSVTVRIMVNFIFSLGFQERNVEFFFLPQCRGTNYSNFTKVRFIVKR